MMENKSIQKESFESIVAVNLPNIGSGTMRTSSTYVAALLQLENADFERLGILIDVAKMFGFTLEQIEDMYNNKACPKCSMSMYLHKHTNGGNCF